MSNSISRLANGADDSKEAILLPPILSFQMLSVEHKPRLGGPKSSELTPDPSAHNSNNTMEATHTVLWVHSVNRITTLGFGMIRLKCAVKRT